MERSTVLATGLRMIDEHGLDALSIRSLAAEMGVFPTSIQWHVKSKGQLLADVSAMIFDELQLPNEDEMSWVHWLEQTCHAWRQLLHRHPNVVPVISTQLVIKPDMLPVIERIIRVFEQAGFHGADLVNAYNTYMGCLVGWIGMELSTEPASQDATWRESYARELRSLPPTAFPALVRNMDALDNNAFMTRYDPGRARPMDDSFAFATRLICDGLRRQAPNR